MKRFIITSLISSYLLLGGLLGFGKAEAATLGDSIIDIANDYIGVPYKWGGTTPSGFDCSGFVGYVYKKVGITLPRTAADIYYQGNGVAKSDIQKGDLVFFSTYKSGASHIGIYIGNNQFIHASSNGVKSDYLSNSYWKGVYIGAKRVLNTGWKYTANKWYFFDEKGNKKTGWLMDDSKWYYLDSTGAMKTGWLRESNVWYYLTYSGSMKTGWLLQNGKWYFMFKNGSMAHNTTIGGYVLGSDGAWIQ